MGASIATVGCICIEAGVARLPPIAAAPPKWRHERQTSGELLHMDMKKLARFERPGHRVTGNPSQFSRTPGYHAVHVAIDDHSRVGFSKILPNETIQSVITFTFAALRYYRALGVKVTGIMTDNGSAYRSKKFAKLLRRLKIRHLRTRPYTPRTNGKHRAFYPDAVAGVGLCLHLSKFRCPYPNRHSGSNTTTFTALTPQPKNNRQFRASV